MFYNNTNVLNSNNICQSVVCELPLSSINCPCCWWWVWWVLRESVLMLCWHPIITDWKLLMRVTSEQLNNWTQLAGLQSEVIASINIICHHCITQKKSWHSAVVNDAHSHQLGGPHFNKRYFSMGNCLKSCLVKIVKSYLRNRGRWYFIKNLFFIRSSNYSL